MQHGNIFQKFQYGLPFDEDNPDVIDISEDKKRSQKILQNDIGPSQNKSYDKRKTQSLDECAKNTINGLRAIPNT